MGEHPQSQRYLMAHCRHLTNVGACLSAVNDADLIHGGKISNCTHDGACLSEVNDACLIHGGKISHCTHVGACLSEISVAYLIHDEKIIALQTQHLKHKKLYHLQVTSSGRVRVGIKFGEKNKIHLITWRRKKSTVTL